MLQASIDLLSPIATLVVLASCKATAAIATVLLCRRWLADRLSARIRGGLWLVVLAALLLPVGFDLPIQLGTAPVAVSTAPMAAEVPALAVRAPTSQAPSLPDAAIHAAVAPLHAADAPSSRVPLQSWLVLSWVAVVAMLAALPLSSLYRYRRLTARAAPVSGPARELLQQCQQQTGMRRSVRLLQSAEVPTPAVFGWLSPTLLLPRGLEQQLGSGQLRHVFLHELAHVQRHDILVNWLATCAQILHWFNPLVWYGLRVMRADMEQACDARVLDLLSPQEHAEYGRTLIGVLDAFPGSVPAQGLGVIESSSQLKERIMRIAKFGSRQARSPALAMVLLLGLASVAATQPHVTARVAQNAPVPVPVNAPSTDAAVLVTQAAQPVPAASPAAAAAPKQPSSEPRYTPDEAQEATRAFAILGQIVGSGLLPDSKLQMSILGLYPEDPRTLLPAMNRLMDEYRQFQDASSLCPRKDVVTIEMFKAAMREQTSATDSWRIRKWQEFLASLSIEDKTPRAGEPRRFEMQNTRYGKFEMHNPQPGTGNPPSFDQVQFDNFVAWRDGGCQVAE